MNCCNEFGQCTRGPGCPVRPFLITDEGPAEVDTDGGLVLEDYPDWQAIGQLIRISIGLFLLSAALGFALGVWTSGWPL